MNITVFMQSLKQMWGIIVLEHKYKGNLPSIDNYHCTVTYSLPFRGQWVAVNGGVVQAVSHSWEVPTQRYAYDFFMLNESGKSYKGSETIASSFYCYGQDILAPADGIVVEMKDGNPDSIITLNRDASCAAHDIRGLPIEFGDVLAVPVPNYEQLDDRPIPDQWKDSSLPYITRGQAVRMITGEID